MVGKVGNIVTGVQESILESIRNTQRVIDKVELALASGKDVNSAVDNPKNYFSSRSLSYQAEDLGKLLDGVSLSIRTIQGANQGAEAIIELLDEADALLDSAFVDLYSGDETELISELSDDDISAVLAVNPGLTYSATSQSFYQVVTVNANWNTANANAQLATLIEPTGVSHIAGVTGHLATITSQEENDFIDSITVSDTWLGGSDSVVEGAWRWVGGQDDGQQFWQGGTGGTSVNGLYENWSSGTEPNNSGNEDAVHMRTNGKWNDRNVNTSLDYVIEWDASLYTYVPDPDLVDLAGEYNGRYLDILEQIDFLAKDTQFRGIGLLNSEDLRTDFNAKRTSFLLTEAVDATSRGLGLVHHGFLSLDVLNQARDEVREAREFLRSYVSTLQVDLSIISTRQDFLQNNINTYNSGADDLLLADQNQKGAELLALQVRQQLQFQSLRLSSSSPVTELLS